MKTFLRKVVLSFVSMMFGWIACNVCLLPFFCVISQMKFNLTKIIMMMLSLGFSSGVVVLAAWLLVFLPVDLLAGDNAKIRKSHVGGIWGFVVGSMTMTVALVALWQGREMHYADVFRPSMLLLVLGAGITGSVAAVVRSRNWPA